MGRKRVAVSQRVMAIEGYDETRDALDQEWATWIDSLGLMAVPVPNKVPSVSEFCQELDVSAIFLTGGNNISCAIYDPPQVEVAGASPVRDRTEAALIDLAEQRRLPLIGWCRGLQMLQTYYGGPLGATTGSSIGHVATVHEVELLTDEHRRLAGSASLAVNSFHDFGVRREVLVEPLVEIAVSSDGYVEAAKHVDLPMLGVQWHPERASGPDDFNRELVHELLSTGLET